MTLIYWLRNIAILVVLPLALLFVLSCSGGCGIPISSSLFAGLESTPQPPPSWSPDGSLIAFGFAGGVYTVKLDGSGLSLLAGGGGRANIDHRDRASSPSISPDGTRIAYAAFKHDGWLPWDTDYGWDIVTSALDGSDRRRLTSGEHDGVMYVSPVWSPDGTRIAFLSNQEEPGGQFGIYTMSADGSDVQRVVPSVDVRGSPPVWSPDSRSLAFLANRNSDFLAEREPDASRSALYAVGVDGSNLTRLGQPSRNFWFLPLSWSPDGSRIAFVRENDELKAIFTVAPDGSDLTKLYEFTYVYKLDDYPVGELFWSPGASRIFFINENGLLGVVNADGSDPRAVATVPVGPWPRASRSRDGSSIAIMNPCRYVGRCSEADILFTMDHNGSNARILARYKRNPGGQKDPVEAAGGVSLSTGSLPDLRVPGPDLIVSDLYLESRKVPLLVAADMPLELESAVTNDDSLGVGPIALDVATLRSDATTLRYFRSSDETIDRSDTQIGTNSVSAMNLGDSFGLIEITLTAPLPPGTYYYGACVDPVPEETDTTNNCSTSVEVTVQPAILTPHFVGDVADITATVGDEFTVDISSILSTPDGSELVTYGFAVRPRGTIRGIIEANTGVLTLEAVATGEAVVTVDARDIHGHWSDSHDLFKVTVVPAQTSGKPDAPTGLTDAVNSDTQGAGLSETPPCAASSGDACVPRDVSGFDLFRLGSGGAAYGHEPAIGSVENVLEKGLFLLGASPVHIAFRGTADENSVRCDWRGAARTLGQREEAIRFWLGKDDDEPLQSASQVEAEFMSYLRGVSPCYRDYVTASFVPIVRGGLSTDLTVLNCYAEYTAAAYLLADLQKSL